MSFSWNKTWWNYKFAWNSWSANRTIASCAPDRAVIYLEDRISRLLAKRSRSKIQKVGSMYKRMTDTSNRFNMISTFQSWLDHHHKINEFYFLIWWSTGADYGLGTIGTCLGHSPSGGPPSDQKKNSLWLMWKKGRKNDKNGSIVGYIILFVSYN